MDNNIERKESKFIDNVAYKNKFQFIIWINDNVICQRYFKINGFNEESIYSKEFYDCMDGIVDSIKEDLNSKSRIFTWCTNMKEPLKLVGFVSDIDIDMYGSDFFRVIANKSSDFSTIETPDGKTFTKTFMEYGENADNGFADERPSDGEIMFKFSFLIDNKTVYENMWDGNVYPKFVRNGVDLTNTYSGNSDTSSLNFSAAIVRYMQRGKQNLINDFIHRVCDTLSNTYSSKYEYTKDFTIGDRKYDYMSAYESYKRSWEKAVSKKTREYFSTLYPSSRQIDYIEKYC